MATPSDGSQVVVTPIYWAPSGYSFTASYQSVINGYLTNLAADSGKATNVFATNTQYPGNNGTGVYHIVVGTPITDTTAFPASGCTVDSGAIYSDNSGYSACLDDNQIATETSSVLTAHGLARDLGHLYVMFTPKGVESCFYPTGNAHQACTLNYTPSAAYCAYHSAFPSGLVAYAEMPFPIYQSGTHFTCNPKLQTPNSDLDADSEISPLSHEMSEAITDPLGNAWYDKVGNENGDDCAYIYGHLAGTAGARYNQTINGAHYLSQEEFSNDDYVSGVSGCIQQEESPAPTFTGLSPTNGPATGGQTVTITGTNLTGATSVKFGTTLGTSLVVVSSTTITIVSPAHAAGTVAVRVTTPGGTTAAVPADRYKFLPPAPAITSIAPTSGPIAGGQLVTVTGTDFTGATKVTVGSVAASFTVVSSTEITVTTPAHAAGVAAIRVTTAGGFSALVTADRYTYV